VSGAHPMGYFIDDLQPHVLEHGQDVGERQRHIGVKDLESQLVPAGVGRTVEVEGQLAGLDDGLQFGKCRKPRR